ncbi:MAG TPA: 5-oxoprolinase subunit PxpA [Opitutaceae bacterium]|nr:5-oxoprolinase subunit PxpA [Opitutaceae bacterium]
MTVDLNCDLGEGASHDAELLQLVTSANIACGVHAGDAALMKKTVTTALAYDVAVGAHPSLRDTGGFGRRELSVEAEEVYALVLDQLRTLGEIAQTQGATLRHVKPHGALYNQSARDPQLAKAVASAVYSFDPGLILFGLAGSFSLTAARTAGLSVASEAFVDRTYQPNGSLTPRTQPGALIDDIARAIEQAKQMVLEHRVRAVDGSWVELQVGTLCIHGDGPHAVEYAKTLRSELERSGVEIKAPQNIKR